MCTMVRLSVSSLYDTGATTSLAISVALQLTLKRAKRLLGSFFLSSGRLVSEEAFGCVTLRRGSDAQNYCRLCGSIVAKSGCQCPFSFAGGAAGCFQVHCPRLVGKRPDVAIISLTFLANKVVRSRFSDATIPSYA